MSTRIWLGGVRIGASLLSLTMFVTAFAQPGGSAEMDQIGWPVYGGSAAGDRYSALTQIDTENVSQLEQVWRVDSGPGGLQTSPLMINGMLYATTPNQKTVALAPTTGDVLWEYDPGSTSTQPIRGLAYWSDGNTSHLFSSYETYLVALSPDTGVPVPTFGEGGRVDLREGLDRDPSTIATFLTSPAVVFKDLVIVGFRTSETAPAAPGSIRAYDARTGKLRWKFNIIPAPGEPGHETWPPDAWKTAGAANNWAGMVVDDKRGILFVPTGSAVDDFYGADRLGDNLYASSLIALDAATGRRLWHFQGVHHDIWDRDFPTPPVLLTVRHNGESIDAVAQGSKQGMMFLFDRLTGEPLFPIEERPVPPSDVPGERASPTQPFTTRPAPFARQRLTADMLTNRTPEARADALKQFEQLNNEGPFTPLTVGRQTVVFPGFDGGAEWGGPAVDRRTGVIYVNSNDIAWTGGLTELDPALAAGRGASTYQDFCSACHGVNREGAPPAFPPLTNIGERMEAAQISAIIAGGMGRMPGFPQIAQADRDAIAAFLLNPRGQAASGTNVPESASGKREVGSTVASDQRPRYRFTGYRKFLDPQGYPAVAPPWGTLNAIDLNSGEYLWKIPLGEYPELAAQGLRDTGSENYGGPIVTAGNLVIIGATIYDRKLRVFDSRTGKLLWQGDLPFAGIATPITYAVDGRQFIVIATSGARDRNGPQGSAYVAFALGAAPAAAQENESDEEGASTEKQLSGSGEALAPGDARSPDPGAVPAAHDELGAIGADDAAIGERQVYTPQDFVRYAPRTALDMLRNVPGFSIEGGGGGFGGGGGQQGGNGQQRGIGQASGNVLVNGERLTSKSTGVTDQLTRIAARDVTRIEIVDGSTLNIPGLSGRVANVVARAGGASGRFEWRPQASTGPAPIRWTQGDVSISGTTGRMAYTLSLLNDSFYAGSGGPDIFTYPSGFVDARYNEVSSKSDTPKLGANLRFDFGEKRANLNLSYGRRWFRAREDEFRTDPAVVPLFEELNTRDKEWDYEISGDVEFPFGPGRMKLIALDSFETSDFRTRQVVSIDDGSPDTGSRFVLASDVGERVGRAEYRWAMLGGDWQYSAEAAFNRLDNVARLFNLDTAGDFVEIPFPAATGGVREDRYESLLTYSRPLTSTLSLQLTAGGEHSTIAQTGANALSREFLRPKGTLNLAWSPREDFDLSLDVARRVGQLDFADFLATVDLSQDNTDAGNNELRPPQSWEAELELNRNFGAWGSASVTLFYDWIEDYVTVIPVAGGGESSGNVPSAIRRGYSVEGTWQMDPIGFAGAKLDFNLRVEDTSLDDPVTGIERAFDRARLKQIRLDFRHDVPQTDWAWGAEFRRTIFAPYFRVSEFGYDYNNPTFGAVFVEHKDVLGLTVRARAANLFKGDTVLNRWVYAGPRDRALLLFHEDRRRAIGYVFGLLVSGGF